MSVATPRRSRRVAEVEAVLARERSAGPFTAARMERSLSRAMSIESNDPRARVGFGIANVAVAAFAVIAVFRFLPTRWWVVDAGAVAVGLLFGSSGLALLARAPIAERLTRYAAAVVLALGLAAFTAIVATASWISGVYGQVGLGGAVVFGLVAALVLPYVVVLPAIELAWVGPRARTAGARAPRDEGRGGG